MKFLVEILVNALGEPEVKAAFDSIGSSSANSAGRVEQSQTKIEAALRRTQEAAVRLQSQMADTTKSTKFIADTSSVNAKLEQQIAALQGGAAGLLAYTASTREAAAAQQILAAQVRAGVAAESEAGQQIAKLIQQQIEYNAQISKLKAEMPGAGAGGGFSVGGVVSGIGEAVGQVMALYASVMAVKGAVLGIIEAGSGIEGAMSQLSAGVISTGKAAGFSADQLMGMALQIQHATGRDQELVASAESVLLTFTRIKHEQYFNAMNDALDISVRRHIDLQAAILTTGKIYEGYLGNAKRVGIILKEEETKKIKDLFATGQVMKAQILIHELLQTRVEGSALAYRNTLGGALESAQSETKSLTRIIAEEMSPAIRGIAEDYIKWAQSAGGQAEIAKLGRALAEVITGLYNAAKLLGPAFHGIWIELKILLEIVGAAGNAVGWLSDKVGIAQGAWIGWAEDITGVKISLNSLDFDKVNTATDVSMGHVLQLREAYGKLGESAIEAAQKEIKAMEARAADLEQQAKDLNKSVAPAVAAGQGKMSVGAVEVDVSAVTDQARKATEEATNLRNIIANLNDRLGEHVKAAKAAADGDDHLGKAASNAMHNLLIELEHKYDSALKEAAAAKISGAAYEQERIAAKVLTEQDKYSAEARQAKTKASQSDLDMIEKWVRGTMLAEDRTKAWLSSEKLLGDVHAELAAKIEKGLSVKIDTTSLDKTIAQEQKLGPIQAAYNDALYKTAAFTEAANIKRKVEIELGKQKHDISDQARKDIEDQIASETAEETLARTRLSIQLAINQAEAQTRSVVATVADWESSRAAATQYGGEIASILQQYGLLSQASQRQAIDEKVLSEQMKGATAEQLADYRNKLEAQQGIDNSLRKMQADIVIAERNYKALADSLATNLSTAIGNVFKTGDVKISDFVTAIRDSFASTMQKMIQDWLTQWFEAMAQWLARWMATQAIARAVSASGGENADSSGGVTSMASSAAWSAWAHSGSTGAATGSIFGSAGTAGVAGSGSGAAGLFSGTGAAGAVGMVAAWVVALAAFGYAINKLNDHMQGTEQDAITLGKTLDISMPASGGGAHMAQLEATGKQLAYQIQQFFTSYDGIFSSLDESIGLKRRGRGSNTEWKVYADGIVTSFGKDMNAALGYAMIEAVKHSSSTGLDPLVVAAIKDYTGKSIDEFKAAVDFAQRLATQNLPGISGQMAAASQQYFSDLHQAQTQFAGDVSALNDATASIAQKFSDTVRGIKNSVLGIDTSTADFLAGIAGFQAQVSKSSEQVATQLQQMIDAATTQLAGIGSGPKPGKIGNDAADNAQIQSDWDKQRAALVDQIKKYTDELAKVPKALSDSEVNMAVFDSLYKYLQGSSKYAALAAEYAKEKVDAEFDAMRLQLIVLGKWEQFAGMWADALAAAEGAAIHTARQKPGGGGGTSIADQQKSLRDQINKMMAEAKGALASSFFDLQQSIADFAAKAKAAKLPADEVTRAINLMTAAWRKLTEAQADAYAGIGTDFTNRLQAMLDFFKQLAAINNQQHRKPKAVPDPREGEALRLFGLQLQDMIDQFRGMVDPMLAINTQADAMRQNIIAYGKAMGWTDDQINKMLAEVNAGVEYQRQNAINGILGNLYNYLKDSEAYQKDKKAFDLQMMELNFQLMEAQLKALGAWNDSTAALWTAAHDAAKKEIEAGTAVATSIYRALGYQAGENHSSYDQNLLDAMNSAAQAWQNGIAQFTQQTQSLMLNQQLSGLSPQQQMAAAQSNFRTLLAQTQGGDTAALGQLDQARQAYLQIARTMFGGGAGFDAIWNEVMSGSANVLGNAANEQVLAVQQAAHDTIAGAAAQANATRAAIYAAADQVANAIWAGLSGMPHYANGGIALHPHMAIVGERGPEAIIPFNHPAMRATRTMTTPHTARELYPQGLGRVLPMAGSSTGSSTGTGHMVGGGADTAKVVASIDRLTKAHEVTARKNEDRAKRMETHAESTARTNRAMAKAENIRVMIAKRSA